MDNVQNYDSFVTFTFYDFHFHIYIVIAAMISWFWFRFSLTILRNITFIVKPRTNRPKREVEGADLFYNDVSWCLKA
jgi:hypothetical protein